MNIIPEIQTVIRWVKKTLYVISVINFIYFVDLGFLLNSLKYKVAQTLHLIISIFTRSNIIDGSHESPLKVRLFGRKKKGHSPWCQSGTLLYHSLQTESSRNFSGICILAHLYELDNVIFKIIATLLVST